jgi:hypothetical protein
MQVDKVRLGGVVVRLDLADDKRRRQAPPSTGRHDDAEVDDQQIGRVR